MKNIMAIASIDRNYGIGCNNKLLWHNKEDMRHFRTLTDGATIIMGRRTYDSIGRPLPNRQNIVLTKTKRDHHDVIWASSKDEALTQVKPGNDIWIIGGQEIYHLFYTNITMLYLTRIDHAFPEVDTFFPQNFTKDFVMQSSSPREGYTFEQWVRLSRS